jgi:hypothetical protein
MMLPRPELVLGGVLVAAVLILPACSQEVASESAGSATESAEPPTEVASTPSIEEEVAPHEMTCGEISETFGSEEFEEEASYLAVWAYGVRTGVEDLDFESHPVTEAGLESFITKVILTCEADPDKLFVDAILE